LKVYFKNPESVKYNHEIKLAERFNAGYDFDVLVKIIDKKQLSSENILFIIMDETDV